MDTKAAVAELIGTFTLVFIGTATAVFAGSGILGPGGGMGILAIAFAFGFTLLVRVYAIGPISGCHVNPAVTVAPLCAVVPGSRGAKEGNSAQAHTGGPDRLSYPFIR